MRKTKYIMTVVLILLLLNLTSSYFFNYDVVAVISGKVIKDDDSYNIIVDLDDHILYLYKGKELVKRYPVSSGKYSTPSPLGTWKITSEANWGEGFGGSWMGFNVPWGKYGIHGTDEPWSIGSPLSKGCIRMYSEDAKELRKIVHVGTPVTIFKGPYGPFGEGIRTIKPGDIGSDVYAIQKRLQKIGYYNGWVDGKYGDGMLNAVYKFQKDNGLSKTKYLHASFYKALGVEPFE